jgi:hypothetical protein
VTGVPEIDTAESTTAMLKGASEVVLNPSVTEIPMLGYVVPMRFTPGVPVMAPVVVLKLAQEGRLVAA